MIAVVVSRVLASVPTHLHLHYLTSTACAAHGRYYHYCTNSPHLHRFGPPFDIAHSRSLISSSPTAMLTAQERIDRRAAVVTVLLAYKALEEPCFLEVRPQT